MEFLADLQSSHMPIATRTNGRIDTDSPGSIPGSQITELPVATVSNIKSQYCTNPSANARYAYTFLVYIYIYIAKQRCKIIDMRYYCRV